ncbi:glutathione synthetase ATP-binding domain-like protein [Pyrenochaeta sp. DS3sAY3a]|nr:glutathione synthetase ATP-binding domain-like protein [Pyrenochaeta sp. DS3sAY3a]
MASVLRILRRRTPRSSFAVRVVSRSLSTTPLLKPRVAVLYQELDPPLINGVRKPKKPGGYKDSGADIAYVLQNKCEVDVATPSSSPDSSKDEDWCFGDTEQSILRAVNTGATHLWANTILFTNHPLQMSAKLASVAKDIKVVGQPPKLVELFDDKCLVNNMLRARSGFTLPGAQDVRDQKMLQEVVNTTMRYPVVAKPVRGRGSYGVRVCRTPEELIEHCKSLLYEQASVIVEDYLAGQEATITVMPPSPMAGQNDYWAMPVVERFNHADGIAPYNGIVAVTQNSRCVSKREHEEDFNYGEIQRQCVEVARLLQCKAPIRVDVRRSENDRSSPFALFDVNMKPNMTGPGRPGRESQASLTALAAKGIGWDYPTLLMKILDSSSSLHDLRNVKVPKEGSL